MTQRRSYFINGGVVGDGVGQMAGDPLGTLGDPLGTPGDPSGTSWGPLGVRWGSPGDPREPQERPKSA